MTCRAAHECSLSRRDEVSIFEEDCCNHINGHILYFQFFIRFQELESMISIMATPIESDKVGTVFAALSINTRKTRKNWLKYKTIQQEKYMQYLNAHIKYKNLKHILLSNLVD